MDRRTLYTLAGLGGAVALCAIVFGHAPRAAAATWRVPTDPGEVLESLPFTASDPRSDEIASLRRALAKNPRDLPRALRLARLDIDLSRERADPRYLGHAEAALAPWASDESADVDVLVLRATIQQSLHDFDAALRNLDLAVTRAPTHAQAWLTRAVVLTVRGRYDEARASCAHLIPLASNLVVVVCQTGIDSVTGKAGAAFARLDEALSRTAEISPDEEGWARSSLAEYAARAGRNDDAERSFRRTLELDPSDSYVRATAADFFLDHRKPKEALSLVQGREANDTLLLRIAIAERRLRSQDAESHIQALGARFGGDRSDRDRRGVRSARVSGARERRLSEARARRRQHRPRLARRDLAGGARVRDEDHFLICARYRFERMAA
jgi:Tfp pilus assembly protein PilF